MSVIGVISMKGGVGKTTLAANLAAAIGSKIGAQRALAIDLDPQNALCFHLGAADGEREGLCTVALENRSFRGALRKGNAGAQCLPYGEVDEDERDAFEQKLLNEPHWLAERLAGKSLRRDAVVVLDTPPGPSVYLKQVFDCADIIVMVLLCDAASYATLPAMETWLQDVAGDHPHVHCYYLLNQLDRSDVLNRDVANLLYQKLEQRLTPVHIHRDETVREALAFQEPVLNYNPHGQASHDLARLADWLIDELSR